MIGDLPKILPFTLTWECGSDPKNPRGNVDDPTDKGGRTSRGVTQRTYDGACQVYGWPSGDVWLAPDSEIHRIYQSRFWDRIRGDELPWPLCGALFDTTVLHRLEPIVRRLQQVVGAPVDGKLGGETWLACEKMGWVNSTWLLLQARDDRYEEIVHRDGTQGRFFKGWERRLEALVALLGLPATIDPVPRT